MVYQPGGNNRQNGRLLSKAMEDWAVRNHHLDNKGKAGTIAWDPSVFEDDANRYYRAFMQDNYPNRNPSLYWNSAPVRRALYNL